MIIKGLQTYLETVGGITELVADRIYPHHLPRDVSTYPVLTHQVISLNHLHVLGGAAGQVTARVQLDCWSRSLSDMEILTEAVRQSLDGFSGTMGTISVFFCMILLEHDQHESPKDSSQKWLYRRVIDVGIKYAETIPA